MDSGNATGQSCKSSVYHPDYIPVKIRKTYSDLHTIRTSRKRTACKGCPFLLHASLPKQRHHHAPFPQPHRTCILTTHQHKTSNKSPPCIGNLSATYQGDTGKSTWKHRNGNELYPYNIPNYPWPKSCKQEIHHATNHFKKILMKFRVSFNIFFKKKDRNIVV